MDTSEQISELSHIIIKGASEHNLKNVNIAIPKKKLVVFTGVSGSGKTSLAFDTIFAEGQRRYVESLSSYARQFLGQMEKPKYETIKGLSPAISIEQKAASKNPRSTVGTITEIYDYLRVLFARIGIQYCHFCSKKVGKGNASSMVEQILNFKNDTNIILLSPIVENRKGEYKDLFIELLADGFTKARINGKIIDIDKVPTLAKNKKHNIEAIIDTLNTINTKEFKMRLTDSIEIALKRGNGQIIVNIDGKEDIYMSERRSCCSFAFPQLEPSLFSFNAPLGACDECHGLGSVWSMDAEKIVPNPHLTIREGAVVPWKSYFLNNLNNDDGEDSWGFEIFNAMEAQWGLNFDIPWNNLTKKQKDSILYGSNGQELKITWKRANGEGIRNFEFEGLINQLMRRYKSTKSEQMKTWYEKFMSSTTCRRCNGKRLKPEILNVKIANHSIMDVCALTSIEAYDFFDNLILEGNDIIIATEIIKEIKSRLKFLINVGLDYLALNRQGSTLSGGEAQRIRLASQIGTELTGVLYILDEPSIGLHQRDNKKLINTLKHLRDLGNSLIVVEHDKETMEESDWLVDIGPGAGHLGGYIIAEGTPSDVIKNPHSLTGKYLSGVEKIESPKQRRHLNKDKVIKIFDATENNLKIDKVVIPLGLFTCITGVSGAGKSTLINQILLPALQKQLNNSDVKVGTFQKIMGFEYIDKVIDIDQNPIGRTPRSNPATYTKLFDLIRDLFAEIPEAKLRGFNKGRFSFNVKGGRCEHCQGDGCRCIEMHFLADVYVPCEVCNGKRFNEQTLEVKYKNYSIADILNLSVDQACETFTQQPKIMQILLTMQEVGLGYIKLGQSATTLSGGEAQRLKLSKELARRDTGKTLYILDEPTTGLHFADVKRLIMVLQKLVDLGNSVLVIEHNIDVIKCADWIIDLGPEGGKKGGLIVGEGTPEMLKKFKTSYTAQYL